MREHWREKDWVWRASEGSLRQAVVAAVDRIEALEAALVEAAHYLDRTSASGAAKKIRALISQPGVPQMSLPPPKLRRDLPRVSRCQSNEDDCTYEHCPRWREGKIINHAHCALDRIPDEEDDK